MTFARIAVVDWSAASRLRKGANAIWIAQTGADRTQCINPPGRLAAASLLSALVTETLGDGGRLLIGVDFALGFPAGFAGPLTGRAEALAVWEWLATRIRDDTTNRNNRFAVAAEANRAFPGLGPFWFRPAARDLPDLPLRGSARHGQSLAEYRVVDARAGGAQPVWKLGGAGSVGSQTLTGLPVLWRLRAAFPGQVAVWPFEEIAQARVVLAEVYPSLLRREIAAVMTAAARGGTRSVTDEVQVRLLARTLARLDAEARLPGLFGAADRNAAVPEEGWILGVGAEQTLHAAAQEESAAVLEQLRAAHEGA